MDSRTETPAPGRARSLGKRFGERVALGGIDLEVEAGEILGLVGPNGSGKTTLLRLLAGLLEPSEGEVRVFGFEPFAARDRVMERARFVFAPPALFATLTAREHLRYLARLGAARPKAATPSAIECVLETVGLAGRADERVSRFSFGMRQRLALALALLPRPELLVLDEPTEGLDPAAILELRGVLARLRAEHGIAILLSSHLLIEIDELVDRMLVLSEGRVSFAGTPAELCRGSERTRLAVDRVEEALGLLRARGFEPRPVETRDGEASTIELPAGAIALGDAAALLAAGGVALLGFHLRRATLEEALLERLAAEKRR